MYFVSSSEKNFLTLVDLSSVLLKVSLPLFLKFFLIFAIFEPHVSYMLVSYKNV